MSKYESEISRRRTFAIISHPDAGKTTLTEKFLLYGGAIAQAGVVKGKKNARAATSDWMEIEKQRGISVTSSVMQFQYEGYCINILDTPGHQDFSEDTYRTLMAADSAVMVIDAAKGVEAQTRKLFKVCVMRDIPIFTFINKMDREARDPFELCQELEKELERVRDKGYAFDARELEEHMECVGAPVFGQDGNVMGAISVSSLYKPTEDYDALGCLVRAKAAEISKLLGFLGKC